MLILISLGGWIMNRRYIAIGLICLLIFFAGYGCSNAKQTSKDPQPSLSQTNDPDSNGGGDEIADNGTIPDDITIDDGTSDTFIEFADENPLVDLPDTSCDLIDEAIASNTISRAEGIALKLKAMFEPEKLPSGYQGDDTISEDVFHNIEWDFQWLYDNWDSLDSDQQDFFYPYIALPIDLASVNSQGLTEADIKNISTDTNSNDAINLLYSADAKATKQNLSNPSKLQTQNTTIKTEYLQINSANRIILMGNYPNDKAHQGAYELKWQTAKEAIEYCLPLYKKYFGEDLDKDLLVYICNLPKIYGSASKTTLTDSSGKRGAYYIKVAERSDGNILQATIAHEMFHAFQRNMEALRKTDDDRWLLETTAVWAEDYAYPTFDTEHEYSEMFFYLLASRDLFSDVKSDEYSRHLFIRFLVQYKNDDKIPLNLLLGNKASRDVKATVEKALGDKMKAYAEYSLYNWNHKPFLLYTDIGKFPSYAPLAAKIPIQFRGRYPKSYIIPPTLQGTLEYEIQGDALKFPVVNMYFEYETSKKPTIMALLQTPSGWTKEDWTGLTDKRIDRLEGDNRVDKIVLIVANPDFADTVKVKLNADTTVLENAVLVLHNSTEVKYDDGTTASYDGSYTARMNVEFDENSNSYYYDELNAVYRGKTAIDGGNLVMDSRGTIQKKFDDSEINSFIYSFGNDVLCQFWPYMNESYLDVTTTANYDGGSSTTTAKGIPLAPEVLMHMLQFEEKNGEIKLTVQDIEYVINYLHDGKKITMDIKYEGQTNSMLDGAGTTKTKGVIQYTHYLSD